MSWICPMCSTSNSDNEAQCMVCDTLKHLTDGLGFDISEQMTRLSSLLSGIITSSSPDADDEYKKGNYHLSRCEYELAFHCFDVAAKKGHALSENELGDCYYYGRGCEQDYTKAFSWFEKSATHGCVMGQFNLGYCYCYGKGTNKNYNLAAVWFKKATDQGHTSAMVELGNCYYFGCGVAKNYETAFQLYLMAANGGSIAGMYEVGFSYTNGQGVGTDFQKAYEYYKKAAEKKGMFQQNIISAFAMKTVKAYCTVKRKRYIGMSRRQPMDMMEPRKLLLA